MQLKCDCCRQTMPINTPVYRSEAEILTNVAPALCTEYYVGTMLANFICPYCGHQNNARLTVELDRNDIFDLILRKWGSKSDYED